MGGGPSVPEATLAPHCRPLVRGLLAGAVEIRHLAVAPGRRGRGLGREMVFALPTVCTCLDVVAETDHDAVGFYRRIGFSLESLGELYPGTERFRCRLRLPEAWRQD
ncbi:MAG: GNAT family N-acetyltransferase [Bacillota bacterium]